MEIFVLLMGAVLGATRWKKQRTRAEEERQAAWSTFLSNYHRTEDRDPETVARELVQFDWMQEQGMLPPGYRYTTMLTEEERQRPGSKEAERMPDYIPPGFVEVPGPLGWRQRKEVRQLIEPEVVLVDDKNIFSVVRRMYSEHLGPFPKWRQGTWGSRGASPHIFHILMHIDPDPNTPPHSNMAIASIDGRYAANVSTMLEDDVSLFDQTGVYPAYPEVPSPQWMLSPIGVLPIWMRPIGGIRPIQTWSDAQFVREMVLSVVAALKAGFILAYSPSYPNSFIVLHPWPELGPAWNRRDEAGYAAGVLNRPKDQVARDRMAREAFRLGFGLPLEQLPGGR